MAAPFGLGCAPKVNVTTAPDFDFASAGTYAWITDELVLIQQGDPQPNVRTEANETLVRAAIERELAAKGYTKVAHDDADLLLAFSVGVRVRYRVEAVDIGGDVGDPQTKGTLNIYVLDRAASREVWHANVTDWLSKSEEPAAVVDRAVGRLMAKLPPHAAP